MSFSLGTFNKLFISLALLLLVSLNCHHHSSPQTKDLYMKEGKEYGITKGLFRERWWNFYERGCSFASGEFFDEAIADFKEAVRQRTTDSYRARTYGMHFIDYFPHRELGIVFYHTGHYQSAIEELSSSLSQVETAKAKYFLNKARRKVVEQTLSDTLPPLITNLSLGDGHVTHLLEVELTGIAEDDTFVSSIAVNGKPLFIELAQKKIPFAHKLSLSRGENSIRIEVKDLTDKVTVRETRVLVDREGPLVAINEPQGQGVAHSERVTIRGLIWDESGVASFTLNGENVSLSGKRELSFGHEVVLAHGSNSFPFEARDVVGNLTQGELHLVCDPDADSPGASLRSSTMFALDEGVFSDFGSSLPPAKSKMQERMPPLIGLKELTDFQKVYYDAIFIEGSAADQSGINELTINAIPLRVIHGQQLFFNHLARLQEGVNHFDIRAVDGCGNSTLKTVTVVREIPRVKQVGSRLAVAVLPFEHKGECAMLGPLVYEGLVDALVNQARFNLVGRERDLETALRELKMSHTALVDEGKALQLGRIIAAEGIITGTVAETATSIEIYARFVDSETATVLAAHDVFEQDKSLSALHFILKGLALKFEQCFPLLEGCVIKSEGGKVYIDRGSMNGLKKEMKIIVFREGAPLTHPLTGKPLGCDMVELTEARIEKVLEDYSIGKVLERSAKVAIKVRDGVITK
jgi:TolB-like protein